MGKIVDFVFIVLFFYWIWSMYNYCSKYVTKEKAIIYSVCYMALISISSAIMVASALTNKICMYFISFVLIKICIYIVNYIIYVKVMDKPYKLKRQIRIDSVLFVIIWIVVVMLL